MRDAVLIIGGIWSALSAIFRVMAQMCRFGIEVCKQVR